MPGCALAVNGPSGKSHSQSEGSLLRSDAAEWSGQPESIDRMREICLCGNGQSA